MCLAAFSHSERTFSLPAAAPAGKLTRCLTPPPALATVRLVVTLAAGSPAGSDGWEPVYPRASGPGVFPSLGRAQLPRVSRPPSPNHGERVVGKRYMRWCRKGSSPARRTVWKADGGAKRRK